MALLLTGADEEIATHQLLVEHADGQIEGRGPLHGRPVGQLLELLEVHRVVQIDEQDLLTPDQPRRVEGDEALEDHYFGPADRRLQPGPWHIATGERLAVDRAPRRRDEGDVMLRGKGLGDVERTDRWSRHLPA